MASRARLSLPYPEAAEPERPPPALTSDLLEEIFLRVASPADLARASAACVSFRRLIADHSFLRRYRSIHPPLLLGFVTLSGFHPVEAAHPCAAVARAVARAAEFSFDFLPRSTDELWDRCIPSDVRNGRVLVQCPSQKTFHYWDLAVCDPLSRRYLLLPPITDDLLASVKLQNQKVLQYEASFIPSGGIEEDTFSVILWMQSNTRLGVFVFSSVPGYRSVSMSTNCNDLGLNEVGMLCSVQCAYDCLYWEICGTSTLIKLDMNTMQFCTVDLLPDHIERRNIIVESGESKVAMFSLSYEGTSVDYYTFSRNGSENSHEWHLMSTIPLPANYNFKRCKGPAEGYIFLEGTPIEQDEHSEFFSLEIKSFKIDRVCIVRSVFFAHPYFGFPPSMSPVRIQGYGDELVPIQIWSIGGLERMQSFVSHHLSSNMHLVALGCA